MVFLSRCIHKVSIFFLLTILLVRCDLQSDGIAERLDAMLSEIGPGRYSREAVDDWKIWQEYEFGTGAGNREELIVTNIYIEDEDGAPSISSEVKNWQYSNGPRHGILAGSVGTNLWVYLHGNQDGRVLDSIVLTTTGEILTFKVTSLVSSTSNTEEIVAVLCVESDSEIRLTWYQYVNGKFEPISSSLVWRRVERLDFFQHHGRNKLLLLNEPMNHDSDAFSSIETYGFNFDGALLDVWLCQRMWVSRVSALEICSVADGTFLSLQSQNVVSIYEFKENETKEGVFVLSQSLTYNGLRNSVCFESGHTEYLFLSGAEPALFTFIDNEFLPDPEMEELFNELGEISWVQCLPVETYREECLLLIQLKNHSLVGLSWQGESFKVTSLPPTNIDNFDLSETISIPKYGFLYENILLKVDTDLKEVPRPMPEQMARTLQLQNSLEETFVKQELILDETERRIRNSYFTNPVVTGVWNLSEVRTETVTISRDVTIDSIAAGTKRFTESDLDFNLNVLGQRFAELDRKLQQIRFASENALRVDSPEAHLPNGFTFNGGIEVRGTLHVKDLSFNSFNGFPLANITNDFVKYNRNVTVKGRKSFSSIESSNTHVSNFNGVPAEEIVFDTEYKNYENINFDSLNQLVVNGSLNFTTINGYNWEDLLKRVVWKNRSTVIPGSTTVYGEIVADKLSTMTLNGLEYPDEYVQEKGAGRVEILGTKTFDTLSVGSLKRVKTINGIPYADFITLNGEQSLPNKITFKNLTIEESLQIDKRITGIEIDPDQHRLTLNNINVITADTTFANLHVTGNIYLEDSLNEKKLLDFADILLESEKDATIVGQKTFLGNVRIDDRLIVTSKMLNGHAIDEFATLNGEQEFPNLRKISAPVTFGQLKYKQLNDLENYLNAFVRDEETENCSKRRVIFGVPPILDDIEYRTVNQEIPALNFARNLLETLQTVSYENLEVKNLYTESITANLMNGVNFADFEERRISISKPQTLTGNFTIKSLKAGELKTHMINGMSLDDLEEFRVKFEDLFNRIWNGRMTIDTFVVKGRVQANTINDHRLSDIYELNQPRNVIVDDGFYVSNLEVQGLVNGINFTEFRLDTVFRNDEGPIIFTGEKVMDTLDCQVLEVSMMNGNPVENFLNGNLIQTLSGPVVVKGYVKVENSFGSNGKVNDVVYGELVDRMTSLGNGEFELHGDFRFTGDVEIENLQIEGLLQGVNFDSFLDTVIFQGDDVHISGTKVFLNSVTFRQNFTVTNEYNGLDLTSFNQKAVLIDRDIHIDSEVIFQDDLELGDDLIVQDCLNVKTIANVDVEELRSSAIFLNRPSYVQGALTFTNAIFESNIIADRLNEIDLNSVISLREDQIVLETLWIGNVSVGKLEIIGTVNGHDIAEIFANTLMLSGNQTVTGNITFHGNVQIHGDYFPRFVNGINTSQMVSLDEDEKLTGTFKFASPLHLRKDLRVFGLINGIDPATWESEAVFDSFPRTQVVSGNWFIEGNVTFERDVLGTGLLNGLEIQRVSDVLERRNLKMDSIATGVKADLESTCRDLRPLQRYAENQVYRFKFFDYLQILHFDVAVQSVHHFEAEYQDFLLINLEQCFVNVFTYNGTGFTIVSSMGDFDVVDKWISLKHEGQIYFLTLGKGICGRSSGNLWKFEDHSLTHILDLGSISDVKKVGDYVFLVISEQGLQKWSIEDLHRGLYGNATSYFSTNGRTMIFLPNTERILLVEDNYVHEFHPRELNYTTVSNRFGTGAILSLRAGVFETEMFLYYDEGISENNAFIFDGLSVRKIRQSIPTHKPSSFLVINFAGFVETFLTFVKNGRSLEIFEYNGVEGFVYRESIKMQIDRTFGFKLRKESGLSKRNFLAAIYGSTLTILEAKMYGEKLDMQDLICEG